MSKIPALMQASKHAEADLNRIAYPGQPAHMKMYMPGFERFFNEMPVLNPKDEFLPEKVTLTKSLMQRLAAKVGGNPYTLNPQPGRGEFNRSILAIERPNVAGDGELHEGTEIIMARWGDGFTSPVHGHAVGYMHEELIRGKLLVNMYRLVDVDNGIVRPFSTTIYEGPQTMFSQYANPDPTHKYKHQVVVHSFTSIGNSETLHYLPEHTRDGRDNGFRVEHFDDVYTLTEADVRPLTPQQGLSLQPGDVALVRSKNVPEYGVHYIVITGRPVLKLHGLRPQDVAIAAPNNQLIKNWNEDEPLTLLKLDQLSKAAFLEFHGIKMVGGQVVFPANP